MLPQARPAAVAPLRAGVMLWGTDDFPHPILRRLADAAGPVCEAPHKKAKPLSRRRPCARPFPVGCDGPFALVYRTSHAA